jgi:uncharacterized protein DUF6600
MNRWSRNILTVLIPVMCLFLGTAQKAAADDDPPGRVARLNLIQGSVSLQPAGADDWAAAEVNRPITTGDKVWADQDSQVELHLGSAAIRLGSQTAFTFLNLTDQMAQISVNEGTVSVHLRDLAPDETFEIDTPNLALSLLRPGDYRVTVNEAGDTSIVTIHGGQGEVTGGGQAFPIQPNQSVVFSGTDQLAANEQDLPPADDFDNWCQQRNVREDRPHPNVAADMVGAEDLDDHGEWRNVPEYGQVWVPAGVDAGWAPYRYGHWAWIAPWGWTWVDDASWGFAPFHYGRWVTVGGAWMWAPGPVVVGVRPVYAPALVAWVGGPHFSVGMSVGGGAGVGVAWFPLGPREVYVPPYTVSRVYVTNVNVTNTRVTNVTVTNVYNNYQSNHVENVTYVNRTSVTATSQNAFTSAQPVGRNIAKVDPKVMASAQVGTQVGAGVAPQQRSLVATGGANAGTVRRPPPTVVSRTVVAKTAPPPAPVPFAAQQKALAANGGKPLAPAQVSAIRPAAPAGNNHAAAAAPVRIAPPATTRVQPTVGGNRPGQPAPAGARPSAITTPANPNQPAKPPAAVTPAPQPGVRPDRPPSAQPRNNPPPPAVTNPNQPGNRPPVINPENPSRPVTPPPAATQPPVTNPDNPTRPVTPPPAATRPPVTNPENPPRPVTPPPATRPPVVNPDNPPRTTPPPTTRPSNPVPRPRTQENRPEPPARENKSDKPAKNEKPKNEKPKNEKPKDEKP